MATLGIESNATPPIKTGNFVSSKFEQTVCLEDWWLVKSEKEIDGKSLAIEGFALKKPRAMCVFSSAPIIKRYNICTLRTADGITILIRGPINASRTLENGFSSEMCSQFLLGFPYYWENYANPCDEDESSCRGVTTSMAAFLESTAMLSSLPNFSRGRTNTRTRDHILCFPDVAESSVSTENVHGSLVEKCDGNDLRNPVMHVSADVICSSPVLGGSLPEKTPSYEERSVSEMKHGREKDLLCGIDGETVEKENDVSPDEKSKLNGDRCMYPENKVLTEKLFEENLETSTVGLRVPLNRAGKSSDIDMLITEETLVNKENCGLREGTVANGDNLFANQDNFSNDSCNEPVLPLNEVAKSFDVKLLEIEDREAGTVSDKQDNLGNSCIEDGENATLFSTSKRITRHAQKNLVNSGKASSEHHVSNDCSEEKHASISPNEGLPTKKMRLRRCTEKVLRKEASKDILTHTVNDFNYYNPSEVSVVLPVISKGSCEGFVRSKNGLKGQKKTQADLKISGSANSFHGCQNESLKDASISLDSDVRTVDSSELIVDVPCLPPNAKGVKSLDIKLPGIKETSIDKERGTEENEGGLLANKQDNLTDTGNVPERDSINGNSVKKKSETPDDIPVVQLNKEVTKLSALESLATEDTLTEKKNGENVNLLRVSRRITRNSLRNDVNYGKASNGHVSKTHSLGVNVALTVDLKTSSKRFGSSKTSSKGEKKTGVNLKSSRQANPSSGFISGKAVSGFQGSNVIQLRGRDKLSHGSIASIEGILQESLSEAPLAGTPDILDIAGDYIDHTMEDSPRQVNLDPNVSCSTKLGIDTESAATRTRSRVKNLEGKGHKDTMCREHLSGSDVTSPICKIDAMEEITDSPKGRKTNSRVKISRNKSKVDKPTNRGRSGLDRPNDMFQETVPGKTMWKEVTPPHTAGINRKVQYSNAPEQPGLNLKRSRCGRLLIPPLEYWRNELVIYDEDREITGIKEGTPNVEHPRGSRSEPPKTKRKLLYS